MLDIDITLFKNANAIAGNIFCRIHVNLYYDCAIDFPLNTGCGVLATHSTGLVEHMGCHSAKISADEYLQSRRLVITDQSNDGKTIPATVLYRTSRAFRLIASSMLLLGLTDNLQLSFAIGGNIGWRSENTVNNVRSACLREFYLRVGQVRK